MKVPYQALLFGMPDDEKSSSEGGGSGSSSEDACLVDLRNMQAYSEQSSRFFGEKNQTI